MQITQFKTKRMNLEHRKRNLIASFDLHRDLDNPITKASFLEAINNINKELEQDGEQNK